MRARIRSVGILLVAALLLVGVVGNAGATSSRGSAQSSAGDDRPNILFILTDDLSADLIPYTQEIGKLQRDGITAENFVYSNSLCCPSRSTILSGLLPHNSGVLTNNSRHRDGGFGAFLPLEDSSIAVRLQDAGYRTGMMGKYLNEYRPQGARDAWWYDYSPDYVPPGWDEWHGFGGGGYNHMRYELTSSIDGEVRRERSADFENPYVTDVLSDKAVSFLERASAGDQPFFLEVSTFAPHPKVRGGFVPAPRDRPDPETGFPGDCGPADCRDVQAPRTPAFNADTSDKPEWVRREPLTDAEIEEIDAKFVGRVQMMQAVDDMIARLRSTLVELGVDDNTYIVFGSDNGFHLGQHRLYLDGGKSTPYEYDSVVPLTVVGPGIPTDATRDELVQNVDLFPTFEAMAGLRPESRDGHNILGLLKGADGRSWQRKAAFIEFTFHEQTGTEDPDAAVSTQDLNRQPWTYKAVRTATETYVEYENGVVEYYDLVDDPYQLDNAADRLPEERREALHDALTRLSTCGEPDRIGCWAAGAMR